MIEIQTDLGLARIVQNVSELPEPRQCKFLYADAETTSFNPLMKAFRPYQGDRVCGWALTWDDTPGAWYVPFRHHDRRWNLPEAAVLAWFCDWLANCYEWVNHNVKFDAQFAFVEGCLPADFTLRLGDTITRAKMIDSDRWSHDLKPLCREWLGLRMAEDLEVQAFLEGVKMPTKQQKCQDYGRVPGDILGQYACMDVLANRKLCRWLRANLPEDQQELWETETLLTPVLFDIEREGLRVDQAAIKREGLVCLQRMLAAQEKVWDLWEAELTDSSKCAYDLLVNQLGLPVLMYGKEKEDGTRSPSFDHEAMLLYSGHPAVLENPKAVETVAAIRTFREESRFRGLYVTSLLEKLDANGRVHPSYNQLVRTGRMSCKGPNSQQMSPRAKKLIIPNEDEAFLCADASQMEFRIIAGRIKDDDAVRAYREDPNTDYHQWVADMCRIPRKPAKTVNFASAYGAGRKKIAKQLMTNEEIVSEVAKLVGDVPNRAELIEELAMARGEEIYDAYHDTFPGLKITTARAADLCRIRGWIRNKFGRRRHLPREAAHKAFNSLVQGEAMDVIKERMVAVAPRYNARSREIGLRLFENVHDEVGATGPIESLSRPDVQTFYTVTLEQTPKEFPIPFVWDAGYSEVNWAEAK